MRERTWLQRAPQIPRLANYGCCGASTGSAATASLPPAYRAGLCPLGQALRVVSQQTASSGDGGCGGGVFSVLVGGGRAGIGGDPGAGLSGAAVFYKQAFGVDLPWLDEIVRAKRLQRLPNAGFTHGNADHHRTCHEPPQRILYVYTVSAKEASHGTPSFCIAVPAQDGGHSGLWHTDWPLAGTSGQRLSARSDVLYGVCGTSADSANGHLPAHRTRPTRHGAFYSAAVINCAGQKWL